MTPKPTKPDSTTLSDSKIMDGALVVKGAEFHRAIRSYGASIAGEPETALYEKGGAKPSRTAEMWYTPHGLVCKQRHGCIIIPLANVSYARFE
jgi:hypothetical protein